MHEKVTQKNIEMQEAWSPQIAGSDRKDTTLNRVLRTKPGTLEYYRAVEQLLGKNSVLSEIIEAEKQA